MLKQKSDQKVFLRTHKTVLENADESIVLKLQHLPIYQIFSANFEFGIYRRLFHRLTCDNL